MAKKKKSKPTNITAFGLWLIRSKVHMLNTLIFSAIALILPGQNAFQVMTLTPQEPKLQPVPFELSPMPNVPITTSTISAPEISAKAAYVIDPRTSAVLFEKNASSKLLPASTTKIMTALVALDVYQMDDIVTISNADRSIGHRALIYSGEQLYVADLIKAMLISSGNDAALALAQHYPGGYQAFIDLMNNKASELYLNNSHYSNVSGVETPGHYTSVRDLSLLTRTAMENQFFKEVVNTKSTTITDVTGNVTHKLENINQLLGEVDGVRGVKTGWTQNAGECLVTYSERDSNPLITVVLGSNDRFGESKALIEWAYQNHSWISIDKLLDSIGY